MAKEKLGNRCTASQFNTHTHKHGAVGEDIKYFSDISTDILTRSAACIYRVGELVAGQTV